ASEILENLIDQGRAIGFDQRTYMELSMRLAETYAAREMPAESEALLTELIAIHPPDDLYLRMELLRSHILADMGSVGAAYTNLLALDEKIPNLEWSVDDRRFFHQMTEALDQQWEDLILRADRLFSAALYDESIQIFSEVVKGINNGAYPKAKPFTDKGREILAKVRHRLAEAYYCVGKFEGTATVLSNIQPRYYQGSSELQQLYVSDLYLLGSAARQAGDFQTAEESLKAYLAYGKNFELPHQDEALLELGLNYVKSSKPHLAQQTFEDLSKRAVQPYYKGLAHSYAARIYIDAGNYEAADEALGEAEKLVDSDEPLSLEIHYLRGEALYHMGRWQEAISAYQAALPPVHPERVAWREATLYNIAWANLELGDASGRGSAEQLAYYDRAENVLNSLVGDGADEEVYLSLAKGYLKRAEKLGDDACLGKIDKLLAKEGLFKSMDHALEACLLRAEASRDPDQKETLLAQATDPRFSNAERYGEAWLLRGMNRFEQAKDLHSLQIKDRADAHYQKASDAFSTAFEILRTKNRVLAGQALRHEVQSYFQQGSYENRYMALSLIESLLDSHRDVYTAMREQDELLYYRGLIASYLMPYGEAEELKQLAMESLNRVVEQWPEGSYAADAYNVMGSVHVLSGDYASAEQVYLTLARDYPYSEHVGEAWFWAAEAASALHRDGAIVRKYRRKVFDEHPQTAHAAEAYFKYYNYSDYLQGQGQAMAHLQGMKSLFPNSPHLIVADYLIGLDLKGERRSETGDIVHYADMGAALGAFEEARQHFDFCYEHGLMDSRSLECLVNVR
ncbi:MAG: tetratricopeptide repeat protein, partial [Chlamydiia bacterium]|nr:tetratricopeptide repeat protein [Chlamydiia bacterium]